MGQAWRLPGYLPRAAAHWQVNIDRGLREKVESAFHQKQTRHSNYVIEIKRKREIGREIIDEVERKLKKLSTPRGKSSRTALVYDGTLAPIVETDGYFDAIISFRQLLGL